MSFNYSQRTRSLVEVSTASRQSADALTYEPHFGLNEKPFSLNADSRFVFEGTHYLSTRDGLIAGIRRREGLLVLTGQIGTGKTTLCRSVVAELGRNTYSSLVPDPFASREDLLKMMLIDFGVVSIQDLTTGPLRQASRTELGYLLAEFLDSLTRDAFVVVVIDEAQNLAAPLIEETRILSDTFGASGRLQIVFVGQPELHARLKSPEMRQVDQRVCGYHRLEPMSREAAGGYIQHRLYAAGVAAGRVLFAPSMIDTLHARTGGVPRLINRVCDRALMLAWERRAEAVSEDVLDAALIDVGAATLSPTWDSIVFATPSAAPSATRPTEVVLAPSAAVPSLAQFESEPDFSQDEQERFKKDIENWVAQELAPPTRQPAAPRSTPADAKLPAAGRTPSPRRAQPRDGHSRSDWPRDLRSETYIQRLVRRCAKVAGIAIALVVVMNLAFIGATWASTMMLPPALPDTPAPPAPALNALAVLEVPPAGIEIMHETVAATANHLVAVGVFYDGERADRLVEVLAQAALPAMQRRVTLRGQPMQQIVLGPFFTRAEAMTELRRLQKLGGYDDASVIIDSSQP